jgi:lipid-binding SYLF domain-containing protein/serine/threonine protein kinase
MELPVRFGRYEVRSLIGQGQMGTVYLATDPLIERPVAVKVLRDRPEFDREEAEEWRARFEREVRVTGKISHPNVVNVLDVGIEGDAAFIVMEYVDGSSVEEHLASHPTLPIARVLEICDEVAAALDCAHAHGIVHRDIKPANILLSQDGSAKVADFGVAHVADARMTRTGVTYGTPAFMSPEQATAGAVGPESDQFALAAVAYLMLVGEVPFAGASTSAVLYRLVNDDPVPPQSINPAVSRELGAALLVALAKNPAERYGSCAALAAALRSSHAAASTEARTTAVMAGAPRATGGDDPERRGRADRRQFDALGSRPKTLVSLLALLAFLLLLWIYPRSNADTDSSSAAEPGSAASLSAGDSANPSREEERPEPPSPLPGNLAERARNASAVLEEVIGVAEGIPQRLLGASRCVAVIPGVIKVGFGFGGRHGKGLVSCRSGGAWSTPSFVAITGGSFGLQIGAQSTDLVLVFVSRDAAARLADNKITLGGDASVSAGPVGRTAEAGTTIELESEIYSYSRSKGLFAGVSVEGATLRPDKDANRSAYGRGVDQAQLLRSRRTSIAPELADLMRRLESVGG